MPRSPAAVATAAAAALVTAIGFLSVPSAASAAPSAAPSIRHVHKVGTGAYQRTGTGSGVPGALSTEIPRSFEPEEGLARSAAGTDRSLASPSRVRKARGAAGKQAAGSVISW